MIGSTNKRFVAAACNFVKTYCKAVKQKLEYSNKEKYTKIKCVKLLKTVLSEPKLSAAEKADRLNAVIYQCRDMIVQRHQYEQKIQVHIYEMILPADFIVTCFLNRVSPHYLIQYFFEHIDYFGHLANMPANEPGINPAIDFFFLFASQYNDMPAQLMDADGNYYQQKMERIAGKFLITEDLKSRREQLMAVATAWFWATERFTIQRSEFARSIKIAQMSARRFKKLRRRWRL